MKAALARVPWESARPAPRQPSLAKTNLQFCAKKTARAF
jgi:hypothetical protein